MRPLYRYQPEAKKIGIARNCKWGVQAMRAYLKIPNTKSYTPYEKETEAYNPKERQTVTIINSNQPAKLNYLENSFPVKRERRRKASIMDWFSVKLKIELNRDDQPEDDEENKIKLKTIIKTIQNKDPKNTISNTKKGMDRNQKDSTRNSPKRKHQNTVSAWKISNSKAFTITSKQKTYYCLLCDRHEFDIIHFLTECEGTRKMEMMLFSRRYR